MDTRVSLLVDRGLKDVVNVDALVVPVNKLLQVKHFKHSKELNDSTGGILARHLNTVRRHFISETGLLAYPDQSSIIIDSNSTHYSNILVTVVPEQKFRSDKNKKILSLYNSYMSSLNLAVKSGCRTVVTPVLGLGDKNYDNSSALVALMSAISDFTRGSMALSEICVVTNGKEDQVVLYWVKSLSRSFGIELWLKRESNDFKVPNYVIV